MRGWARYSDIRISTDGLVSTLGRQRGLEEGNLHYNTHGRTAASPITGLVIFIKVGGIKSYGYWSTSYL